MRAESPSSIFEQSHILRVQNCPYWPLLCFTGLKTASLTARRITKTFEILSLQRAVERGRSGWVVGITF